VKCRDVGDLVSRVDFDADRAASDVIKKASSLPILSEELSPQADDVNQRSPVLGLTYFPLTGEWFYAEQHTGAFKNGQELAVEAGRVHLSECWIEVNQYGNSNFETSFVELLKTNLRSPAGSRIMTSNFPHAGVAMRVAEDPNGFRAAVHDNNPVSVADFPFQSRADHYRPVA